MALFVKQGSRRTAVKTHQGTGPRLARRLRYKMTTRLLASSRTRRRPRPTTEVTHGALRETGVAAHGGHNAPRKDAAASTSVALEDGKCAPWALLHRDAVHGEKLDVSILRHTLLTTTKKWHSKPTNTSDLRATTHQGGARPHRPPPGLHARPVAQPPGPTPGFTAEPGVVSCTKVCTYIEPTVLATSKFHDTVSQAKIYARLF